MSFTYTNVKDFLIKIRTTSFFKYFFYSVINAAVSFLTIFMLAKYLSPEEYGKFGLLMTVVYFVPSLLTFCTDSLQPVNIINMNADDYVDYRNQYISFVSVFFLALIGISLFLISMFFTFEILAFSFVIGYLQWMSSVHSTELIQRRRSGAFGILNLINSVLVFIFSFTFLKFIAAKWEYRATALLLAEFAIVILRVFFLSDIYKRYKFGIKKVTLIDFLVFGFPLLLAVIPGWILNQLDKYILLHFFELKTVGYYTFAASISGIVVIVSQSLQKAIRPVLYEQLLKDNSLKKYRKLVLSYCIAMVCFSIGLGVGVNILFRWIPGFRFYNARYIVALAILSQAFFAIYALLVMIIQYYKLSRLNSAIVWKSAGVFILSNILLFYFFSFYTPAVSTLIAFIFLSGQTFLSVKKYF